MEPIAIAEEPCRFHQAAGAKTNRVAAEFVDLEPVLAAIEACEITAVALADDFEIVDTMIERDADGNWKCCRQCPSAAPRRCMGVGDIQQQRRKGRFRCRVFAQRQQIVAVPPNEGSGRLSRRKGRMCQAGREKRLIGRYAERNSLFKAMNEPAPRLIPGCPKAD